MSGFEVAGVVLGCIPIIVEALSTYREGRGLLAKFNRSSSLVGELIHQLNMQRINFHCDILELLREARVPEVLAERDPSLNRCVEILQAVKTGEKVEQYLGPQLFPNFLEILGFYETHLKDITSKLGHIVRPQNASQLRLSLAAAAKDDLAAVIRASKSPDASLSFRGKLKFAIDKESLDALIKRLRKEEYSLRDLARRVKTKREWEASEPTTSSARLTRAFSRVRESAVSLYRAACKCWVCDQHRLHTLMIRLEHRIPESKNYRAASSAPVSFRLCFPIEDAALQRIEVCAPCSDSMTTKTVVTSPDDTMSAAFNGRLKVPSITVTETLNIPYPTAARLLIRSICEDAQKARERQRVLSLELTSAATLQVADKDDMLPHSYDRYISLADFLKDTTANGDARMSPIEQTLLALNVVSSVLQLWPTMWCSQPWNCTTIKFPVQAVDGARADLRTPYIERTIDPAMLGMQGDCPADPTTEAAKTTMLELAILLLEILHHKSMAAWAARNHESDPRTYWERMGAATRWLESSTSKLLPPHIKAVEECLAFCVRSKLSWDDYSQRLYCENIIKPLQELAL